MYTMKLLQEQTKAKIFDEAGNTVKQHGRSYFITEAPIKTI